MRALLGVLLSSLSIIILMSCEGGLELELDALITINSDTIQDGDVAVFDASQSAFEELEWALDGVHIQSCQNKESCVIPVHGVGVHRMEITARVFPVDSFGGKSVQSAQADITFHVIPRIIPEAPTEISIDLTVDTSVLNAFFDVCGFIDDHLFADRPINLYAMNSGSCEQVSGDANFGTYYGENTCSQEVSYNPTSFGDYCNQTLWGDANDREEFLGNPKKWSRTPEAVALNGYRHLPWTNAHGSLSDILMLPIDEHMMGFLKQVEYRTFPEGHEFENCSLEMRVYKKNVLETNVKPFLFIHGGSWTHRGLGIIEAESMVAQLLDKGYMVFSPMYRLLSDQDGPDACQNATGQEVIDDISEALAWVMENGPTLGMAGERISVGGYSAGAHLAGYLSVHQSGSIEKSFLLYSPTDFLDSITRYQNGEYEDQFPLAKSVLPLFLDQRDSEGDLLSIDELSTLHPLVTANSFPQVIAGKSPAQRADMPPMFIIHGDADTIVPASQSTDLCEALKGAPTSTTYVNGLISDTCGTGRNGVSNEVRIIAGAEHSLALSCSLLSIEGVFDIDVPGLCPSGGDAGEVAAALALINAMDWL